MAAESNKRLYASGEKFFAENRNNSKLLKILNAEFYELLTRIIRSNGQSTRYQIKYKIFSRERVARKQLQLITITS